MTWWREVVHSVTTYPALYALLGAALLGGVVIVARMVWGWQRGRTLARSDRPGERLWEVVRVAVLHARTLRRRRGGLMHALLVGAFLILLVGNLLTHYVTPNGDALKESGTLHLVMDVALVLAASGLVLAAWRRYRLRETPRRVEDTVLWAVLVVLTFWTWISEGLFVRLADPPWERLAFASNLIATATAKWPDDLVRSLYAWHWQLLHVFGIGLAVWLPLTKMRHVVAAPLAVFARNRRPLGVMPSLDLTREDVPLGAAQPTELTWKSLLDADACMHCGRCTAVCPAQQAGQLLDPRAVWETFQRPEHGVLAQRLGEDALWACTTCFACEEACPVYAEPLRVLLEMRRERVLAAGEFPASLQSVSRHLEQRGNPWGANVAQRLPLAAPLLPPGGETDVLLWLGCHAAFDARRHAAARALCRILDAAQVSYATLGEEELCCGDPARRMGNERVWQLLAAENIARLRERRFRRLVTLCPHCYNTLRHEYGALGADFVVEHATVAVAALLDAGRIALRSRGDVQTVTYHDPCYLGRANGIYDAPRRLLAALPGSRLVEMESARRDARCCGGGGGQLWLERPPEERVSRLRAADVRASSAEMCATACPYCATMLEEALAAASVRDIIELVADSLA